MTEEPEEVLPEERLPTRGLLEELRTDRLIEEEQDRGARQDRDRQQHQTRRNKKRPNTQREPKPVHSRRPHVDHGRYVVERSHDRRKPKHDEAETPEDLAQVHPTQIGTRAEWRIRRPTRRRAASLDKKAGEHQ